MQFSRRKWIKRSLLVGGGAVVLDAGVIEKHWLSITRLKIPLAPAHSALDGIKLAMMSDFHHDDFGDSSLVRRAVQVINKESVDLVCLLGDYITKDISGMAPLCKELSALRPRLATIAIYGNHDRGHWEPAMDQALLSTGAQILSNDSLDFSDFSVAGIDSCLRGKPDFARTLKKIPKNQPVILARHEPDYFDRHKDPRIAMQISGHSHGGQICLPLYGPLFLPRMAHKYPYGLYRDGSDQLYVTRGIGTLTAPIRFLCRPEVAILHFVRG